MHEAISITPEQRINWALSDCYEEVKESAVTQREVGGTGTEDALLPRWGPQDSLSGDDEIGRKAGTCAVAATRKAR